jgi:hypothetical protein
VLKFEQKRYLTAYPVVGFKTVRNSLCADRAYVRPSYIFRYSCIELAGTPPRKIILGITDGIKKNIKTINNTTSLSSTRKKTIIVTPTQTYVTAVQSNTLHQIMLDKITSIQPALVEAQPDTAATGRFLPLGYKGKNHRRKRLKSYVQMVPP